MSQTRITLFLVDGGNDFQRQLRADAEAAAAAEGVSIETLFTGSDYAGQLTAIQRSLDGDPVPAAIVVLCVNARGLQRVAKRAVQAGVHVFFLNAPDDDLELVRQENPSVAVSVVCPDELETGRIQGRQFLRLVRPGARVLYVQGHTRSETARDRTAGVLEALAGSSLELVQLEVGWTREEAIESVGNHLRLCARANRSVDLIGCQNDMLALGAIEARDAVAAAFARPALRSIPVTGCDGLPAFGQQMVARGELRATVVLPRAAGPAVEAAARVLRGGAHPPRAALLKPESFPSEVELVVAPRSAPPRHGTGRDVTPSAS
jgi:ABC-type sugar transport system substrate-binding protein